jgi:hypothetical protein
MILTVSQQRKNITINTGGKTVAVSKPSTTYVVKAVTPGPPGALPDTIDGGTF